jgi:broad specificity phosphatase PhoE
MRLPALAFLVVISGCAANPSPEPTGRARASAVVILVRHAEKASETEQDPSLSATGQARAAALADALRHAGVTRVIVSHRRRTGETAEPLTSSLSIVPDTVPVTGSVPDHVREVARRIRESAAGGATLVVGHSNTVPAIVTALTGIALVDLCDADYGSIFVVTLPPSGPGRFVRTRFGAMDESGTKCGSMPPG